MRETSINKFAAELLANPEMIKLAGAPPTQDNIKALLDYGARMGYIGAKAMPENVSTESTGSGE
jgi:hypothetical protein